jgi:putative ABC transport system substrate-binding protein
MTKKIFVWLLATLFLATPSLVRAQQAKKAPRIGLLSPFSPLDAAPWHEAFRKSLRELGWVEGKNINIEYRYAEGKRDRLPDLAADLVSLKVDIMVTSVGTDTLVAKKATRAIPIVMASAGDAVASGFVESLARPGGNITGLSQMTLELAGKRLEMLKEIVPKLSRVAVLWNPQNPGSTSRLSWEEIQLPARALGVQLHSLEVWNPENFDKAFEDATRARSGGLTIMPDAVFAGNLRRIAELAKKSRLPSIFHLNEFAEAGGLVAYGPDRSDMFRRAAIYVDKILKGAKPADLPVERPMKFDFVVNLKTAKEIGLTIPQHKVGVRRDLCYSKMRHTFQ